MDSNLLLMRTATGRALPAVSEDQEKLEALSRAIYAYKLPEATVSPTYRSFEDALDEITAMARQQRLVFVSDEYPYLSKTEKSVSS